MTKVKNLAQLIVEAADDLDVDVRTNYSGRSMYGRTCVGVTGSSSDINSVIAGVIMELSDLAVEGPDARDQMREHIETLLNYAQDSMGMDRIYYWPGLMLQDQG